jgi:hypothetical protein
MRRLKLCGELGIRTPGPVTVNSFQDCRNRPLCQLSAAKVRFERLISKQIDFFSGYFSLLSNKSLVSIVFNEIFILKKNMES